MASPPPGETGGERQGTNAHDDRRRPDREREQDRHERHDERQLAEPEVERLLTHRRATVAMGACPEISRSEYIAASTMPTAPTAA